VGQYRASRWRRTPVERQWRKGGGGCKKKWPSLLLPRRQEKKIVEKTVLGGKGGGKNKNKRKERERAFFCFGHKTTQANTSVYGEVREK